jgi:hypothetical protein
MGFQLLVRQSLRGDRFVVTNNSREDIPMGTVFSSLLAQAMQLVDGNFQEFRSESEHDGSIEDRRNRVLAEAALMRSLRASRGRPA